MKIFLGLGKTLLSISKLAGCAPTNHQSRDSTKIKFTMVETGIASEHNTINFKRIWNRYELFSLCTNPLTHNIWNRYKNQLKKKKQVNTYERNYNLDQLTQNSGWFHRAQPQLLILPHTSKLWSNQSFYFWSHNQKSSKT